MNIELEDVKLQGEKPKPRSAKGRPKIGKVFLARVDMEWLSRAAALKGKALHVGIALWYLSGLKKSRTVRLTTKVRNMLSIDRHAGYRALNALEDAGLVTVERHNGRLPVVQIIDVVEEP